METFFSLPMAATSAEVLEQGAKLIDRQTGLPDN
jgi:hypothetical protein